MYQVEARDCGPHVVPASKEGPARRAPPVPAPAGPVAIPDEQRRLPIGGEHRVT